MVAMTFQNDCHGLIHISISGPRNISIWPCPNLKEKKQCEIDNVTRERLIGDFNLASSSSSWTKIQDVSAKDFVFTE